MVVVTNDDFAVARHMNVAIEVLNAERGGGAKSFEGILGMRTGGSAMPEGARNCGREKVGIEMLAHFRCDASQAQALTGKQRTGNHSERGLVRIESSPGGTRAESDRQPRVKAIGRPFRKI